MAILDFNLGPEASNELWTEVSRVNAVTQLSTQTTLSGNGNAIPVLGKATAEWVGRGDKKPVSTPATSLNVIQPYKVATIIPIADELVDDQAGIIAAIQSEGISAISDTINETVLGLRTSPGENFHTFVDADEVTVTDRSSFIKALKAVATGGRRADGIMITAPLLYDLMAFTVEYTNQGVLNIDGGTINGIPYQVVDSEESIAVLGAFKSGSRWGTVAGIRVKVSDVASWKEGDVDVHAFQEDLIAVRVEVRFGFQVANENNFVKFGTEASGS